MPAMTTPPHDLRPISEHFDTPGRFLDAVVYGSGHINDTYCVRFDRSGRTVRQIYQRINHRILKNPAALMENIERVTEHLREKLRGRADALRRTLTLVRTRDGGVFYQDHQGNYWRAYLFIEDARTYDVAKSPEQAFEAAKAFGQFQQMLADLPSPRLNESIPYFHHTPRRFAALKEAIEADAVGRARTAGPEIEFAVRRESITQVLVDLHQRGEIPERTTHNDTKLNNVMLDDLTQEGICVIDLDTVMPGLALYDFGDMVRTMTSPALEDERDLAKVDMVFPMYEALVRGYLTAAGAVLNEAEKSHLAFAGKLITYEIGIRFLADYLSGDVYFKTHREGHNLDRCRTQFKLVESIERQEAAMEQLVWGL